MKKTLLIICTVVSSVALFILGLYLGMNFAKSEKPSMNNSNVENKQESTNNQANSNNNENPYNYELLSPETLVKSAPDGTKISVKFEDRIDKDNSLYIARDITVEINGHKNPIKTVYTYPKERDFKIYTNKVSNTNNNIYLLTFPVDMDDSPEEPEVFFYDPSGKFLGSLLTSGGDIISEDEVMKLYNKGYRITEDAVYFLQVDPSLTRHYLYENKPIEVFEYMLRYNNGKIEKSLTKKFKANGVAGQFETCQNRDFRE